MSIAALLETLKAQLSKRLDEPSLSDEQFIQLEESLDSIFGDVQSVKTSTHEKNAHTTSETVAKQLEVSCEALGETINTPAYKLMPAGNVLVDKVPELPPVRKLDKLYR